jgi:hypothetical protein
LPEILVKRSEFHCSAQKISPFSRVVCQLNPVGILILCFHIARFNNVLRSRIDFPNNLIIIIGFLEFVRRQVFKKLVINPVIPIVIRHRQNP